MTYRIKKIVIFSAIILLFLLSNYFMNNGYNRKIIDQNNKQNYKKSDELSNMKDINHIDFKYNKLDQLHNMTEIDPETITKIIKKVDVKEEFDFYIYSKPKEYEYDNRYYGGIKIDNIFYEIGEIGYEGLNLENLISVTKSSYKNTFIFQGALGANYIITYYITIEDNIPEMLLKGYSIYEIDLDGDGEKEFIDSFSGVTTIYKIKNKEMYYLPVNEVFEKVVKSTDKAFFDSEKYIFTIVFLSTDPAKLYDYQLYIYTLEGFEKVE